MLDVKGLNYLNKWQTVKWAYDTQAANLVVELVNNNMWHEALHIIQQQFRAQRGDGSDANYNSRYISEVESQIKSKLGPDNPVTREVVRLLLTTAP